MTKKSQEKRRSVIWFDPQDKTHCKAYRHLQETGKWPKGFEVLDIKKPFSVLSWQIAIIGRLANAWLDHILGGDSCPVLREMEAKCQDQSQ